MATKPAATAADPKADATSTAGKEYTCLIDIRRNGELTAKGSKITLPDDVAKAYLAKGYVQAASA